MATTDIKIFLLRKGVKQKEIAEELAISEAAISRILSSQLEVDDRIDQIAEFLDISRRRLKSLIKPTKG